MVKNMYLNLFTYIVILIKKILDSENDSNNKGYYIKFSLKQSENIIFKSFKTLTLRASVILNT